MKRAVEVDDDERDGEREGKTPVYICGYPNKRQEDLCLHRRVPR